MITSKITEEPHPVCIAQDNKIYDKFVRIFRMMESAFGKWKKPENYFLIFNIKVTITNKYKITNLLRSRLD